MKRIILLFVGIAIFCSSVAQVIPQKISYQGKLLENGIPVMDSYKSITFTIGSWTETHPDIHVKNGLYSVTLGSYNPIPTSLFDNSTDLKLQVSISGVNLEPSTEILSAPYAFISEKAEKAVEAEKALDAAKIAGRLVSTTSPTENQVLKWNGSSWTPGADLGGNSYTAGTGISISGSTISALNSHNIWNANQLQGKLVSSTIPINGQVLKWNGSEWKPQSDNGLSLPFLGTHTGSGNAFEINHNTSDVGSYTMSLKQYSANNTGYILELYGDHKGGGQYIKIDNSNSSYDCLYTTTDGSGYAGYFNGMIYAQSASSGIKAFKIDHPLDPENKYLYHSSVESPDMMNIYNGNIILGERGEGIVILPSYFSSLNCEYRYQLTCIGEYANVFISEEVNNNRFKISGGKPGLKVSWQITGIRQDPLAELHRIQVEVSKPENERGLYLNYKAYHQPVERSIDALKDPTLLKK